MTKQKNTEETVMINVTDRKNVELDKVRTVSLKPGTWPVSNEIAQAAVKAGCAVIVDTSDADADVETETAAPDEPKPQKKSSTGKKGN